MEGITVGFECKPSLLLGKRLILKQQWGELNQVVAPVEPGMPAGRLGIGDIAAMLFQQVYGRAGGLQQKVLRARPEPDEFQTLLPLRVVQFSPSVLFPGRTGIS